MGLVFDTRAARAYEAWYQSPEGRALDQSLEQILFTLLDPRPGDRALDVGCGSGNHLILLHRLGLDVTGLDASPCMIRGARDLIGNRCALKLGTAEALPFDDNEFDFVVLINTLEFLDHPLEALREAGRVASRKVFVGVINALSWNGLNKKVRGALGDPLFANARFFSLWELKALLRRAYGHAPISWRSVRMGASFAYRGKSSDEGVVISNSWPFGGFLGISVAVAYRVRALTVPLSIKVRQAGQSVIGTGTVQNLKRNGEPHSDEGSLSL